MSIEELTEKNSILFKKWEEEKNKNKILEDKVNKLKELLIKNHEVIGEGLQNPITREMNNLAIKLIKEI